MEHLEERRLLFADPVLLAQIPAGFPVDSEPQEIIEVGGLIYFSAINSDGTSKLWKSDGTLAGTTDIAPDTAYGGPEQLMSLGETVFFVAASSEHYFELWKSDGTDEGTVLVKDVFPGPDPAPWWPYKPLLMATDDNYLYFAADATDDGTPGRGLWRSDGTTEGTVLVADSNISTHIDLLKTAINFNGTVYYTAFDEVYQTDGTAAGTIPVTDLPGSNQFPFDFVEYDEKLYFSGSNSLWATDGTVGGEVEIGSYSDSIYKKTVVGDTLFFRVGTHELWKTDGTPSGTVQLRDFGDFVPVSLAAFDDKLFFRVAHESGTTQTPEGVELWVSDGSVAGTMMLKDLYEGSESSTPDHFTELDGQLFFSAEGPEGRELWVSDGTAEGTELFYEFVPGSEGGEPSEFKVVGDTLYFSATTLAQGRELWKTDGTVAGTRLVKDLRIDFPGDSWPHRFTSVDDAVYFTAGSNTEGLELYRTDGTPSGTARVADIAPGLESSTPLFLTAYNGQLVFAADDGSTGLEPWRTNGTEAGTERIKDINPAGSSLFHEYISSGYAPAIELSVGPFKEFQGELFFAGSDGVDGFELWKTDGTESGTTLVKDIGDKADYEESSFPGVTVGGNEGFVESGGLLFFPAATENEGFEIWKTDGTEAGTLLVKDIIPGPESSLYPYYVEMADVGGTLFFVAGDYTHGLELWKSDGTEAGTVIVKDIRAGIGSSYIRHLTAMNNTLYFTADDGQGGSGLWRSDGTEAGTVLVKDLDVFVSQFNYYYSPITVSGGMLFFAVEDSVTGVELWKSDGTEVGTKLVADVHPGTLGTIPRQITPIDGGVAFTADADGAEGGSLELWVSDGTETGTQRVTDLELTVDYSSKSLEYNNGKLYFSAAEQNSGQQPWVVDLALLPVADAGGSYTVGEGEALQLEATSGVVDLYEWDLDNDGQYDDAVGKTVAFPTTDDGVFTVGLRATGPGGVSTDTATITVSSVAPSASLLGSTDIYRGETVSFMLVATDPSPVDQAGLFTFEIDWDGDDTVDETLVDVPSGTIIQHNFATVATGHINVRAIDKDAAAGDFSQTPATVSPHVLRDDGFGNVDLIYGGTQSLDAVYIFGPAQSLTMFVQIEGAAPVNRIESLGGAVTGRVILHGYDSGDVLVAELATGSVVEIYGGGGNDVIVGGYLGDFLYGGPGDDLILGGTKVIDGNDMLFGGDGRDTLFGHYGADTLDGGEGEDLLVSDAFSFSNVPAAVQHIHEEWKSARPFSERMTNILGLTSTGVNGPWQLQPSVTVLEDGAEDSLIGGIGNVDWFFYDFETDLLGDVIEIGEAETDSDP